MHELTTKNELNHQIYLNPEKDRHRDEFLMDLHAKYLLLVTQNKSVIGKIRFSFTSFLMDNY